MTRAILLLVLVLLACCAPSPVAYQADVRFGDSARVDIWRAARAWDPYVLPELRITEGSGWLVIREEPPGGFGYNGLCRRSERAIWIRPDPIGATTYDVALHEWGHALGLGHTSTGVMMPFTVSTEFTAEVLAECRRVGACK